MASYLKKQATCVKSGILEMIWRGVESPPNSLILNYLGYLKDVKGSWKCCFFLDSEKQLRVLSGMEFLKGEFEKTFLSICLKGGNSRYVMRELHWLFTTFPALWICQLGMIGLSPFFVWETTFLPRSSFADGRLANRKSSGRETPAYPPDAPSLKRKATTAPWWFGVPRFFVLRILGVKNDLHPKRTCKKNTVRGFEFWVLLFDDPPSTFLLLKARIAESSCKNISLGDQDGCVPINIFTS